MAKNKDIKVVIGVPVADSASMKALTAHAIGSTILKSKAKVIDFILRISCDIVSNRTFLVNEAIKNGGTHLLFIDADMVFPTDALDQLLAHNKEIVGVEYNKRKFPLERVCKALDQEDTKLYKGKYSGMGLMLIDLSIFDKEWVDSETGRKLPWFNFGRDSQGALVMGEDAFFSNAAREMGYDTWIDPTIPVKHCGDYLF